jgi:hypothetical protein
LEQAHGFHSFNERDLSAELEKLRKCVAGVESECATKAVILSLSVMGISNALVDLGVFPIQAIPKRPKSAQVVLTVSSLILERLREEHASDDCSWV